MKGVLLVVDIDREWFQKWIDRHQERLERRADDVKLDLASIDYSDVDRADPTATPPALAARLIKKGGSFSCEDLLYVGSPEHLRKLEERDFERYVALATERHEDAKGEKTKKHVRYQAEQLYAIRNAYAELCRRSQ